MPAEDQVPALPPGLQRAISQKTTPAVGGSKAATDEVADVDGAVSDTDDAFDLLADVEASSESDESTDEGGPEHSGELPDESIPDESDDGDESGEEEPEEGEEQEGEETSEQEETPPPQDVTKLQAQFEELKQQNALLLAYIMRAQQPPQQNAPLQPSEPEVPDNVIRAALFGGPDVDWNKVPAGLREKAQQVAESYFTRETRYAKEPSLRYQEQFRKFVAEDVLSLIQPLVDDYHERQAAGAIEKNLGPVKDPALRKRAMEIFHTLPGSKATSWKDRGLTMEAAVKVAKAEFYDRQKKDLKQKRAAGKAQAAATGGGKLKGAPRAAGSVEGKKIPDMLAGESPLDYAKRIGKFFQ